MGNTRLKNVCDGILQRWDDGKEIQETQIHIIEEELLNILITKESEKLPSSYTELYRRLREIWHYRDFYNMKETDIFLLGSVWNCMELLDLKYQKSKESLSVQSLAIKYDKYQWFFATLERYPGLKHAELAKIGNKTPSELSQFTTRIAKENLYYDNRIGREKYYYLTERGEELLKEMKKRHEQENTRTYERTVKKLDEKNTIHPRTTVIDAYRYAIANCMQMDDVNFVFGSENLNLTLGKIHCKDNNQGEERKITWQCKKKNSFSNSMNSYVALEEMI